MRYGVTITADEQFNVGTGPWLILEGVAIPEPSAVMLLGLGVMLCVISRTGQGET